MSPDATPSISMLSYPEAVRLDLDMPVFLKSRICLFLREEEFIILAHIA
jgi:hypothetical protein